MGRRALKSTASLSAAAAEKLRTSGLTVEQAAQLGVYDVGNAATLHKWFEAKPALVLPYYDIKGAPLKAHKAWPEFYRIRYLGKDVSFTDATGAKKPLRYSQPSDTGVCAYFPQLIDWEMVASDYREPLCITEGELKAACATANGVPTIGLGGVFNFRHAKDGVFFLPELEKFDWARRRVFIVYDSDYQQNPNICRAINALAEELQERGALCQLVTLESVYEEADRKTGLDDFIVERGADAFTKLLDAAEPIAMTNALWQMNDQICYVADPGFIVDLRKDTKIPVATFTGHSDWATANVPERVVQANGNVSYKKISAAQQWVRWPLRNRVDKLTYLPGKPRFTEDAGAAVYNTWAGWGVEPVKGDVTPFLKLFDFVFEGISKEEKEWVLSWMACPIIRPGTKLFSAIVVHGRTTGTGKTFLGYTLARIYGKNFIEIKNENLHDTWWAENRQFVVGNEISGTDKRQDADAMKNMITQETININIKFIPQFTIPDCVNYYLTSNHADALWLEDEDRRFFVHEVPHTEPLALEFYSKYEHWLDNGGAAALMEWFLRRDISAFNPKGPPPRTAARERMINMGKSDLDAWCADLRGQHRNILRVGQLVHQRDLFTSKELLEMYQRDNENAGALKVTPGGMARALARAGFKQAYDGMPIATLDGKSGRYYVIRNRDKWLKGKTATQLAKHIAQGPVRV
ncbi:MAG: DUF3854 domain-containing protein [Desulfurellales bacterium]|nr:MAG: DUF3854 domain-containing protein [Desulfurellales bacterium]